MENLLEGLDSSLRVTGMIGDSIMMGIVNSAMEEAYERILCSREGGLEWLYDKSRFCGLAIMQLEWCLRFLQGEVDACIVESDDERERLVGDLRATRNRIRRRLEETESALSEKESELEDVNESRSELRRALEDRDEELRTLRTSLAQERARHGEVEEGMALGGKAGQGLDDDEKITSGEPRTSAVQHVEDFSCKLMAAKNNVSDLIQKLGVYCSSTVETLEATSGKADEEGFTDSFDKIVDEIKCVEPTESLICTLRAELGGLFEQLSLDMVILKKKLLLAFETADEASKAAMYEQQLRWWFEKETLNVLHENLLKDLEERYHSRVLGETEEGNWSSVVKDFGTWNSNLEQVAFQLDKELESGSLVEIPASGSKDAVKESSTDHPCNLAVEIQRSHDHVVRKKTRGAMRPRAEICGGKRFQFFHSDRELRSMKTRITETLLKLECFLGGSTRPPVASGDPQITYQMGGLSLQDNLSRCESAEQVNDGIHASSGAPRKGGKQMAFYPMADDVCEEKRCLKEDREDSYLESMVLEETNANSFDVFVKELYHKIDDYKLETFLKEDICNFVFSETMKESNHEMETCYFGKAVMEEIDRIVFSQLVQDMKNAELCLKGCNEEYLPCSSACFHGPWIDEDVVQGTGDLSVSFEVEGKMLPNPNSEIMEQQMHSEWSSQMSAQQSLNYVETLDEDGTFCSSRKKQEKALEKITVSKMQLRQHGSALGVSLEEKECAVDKSFSHHDIVQDREQTSRLQTKNKEECLNEIQSIVTHLTSFSQDILDLELIVYEKTQVNMSRLEELNRQMNLLVQQASSLRKKELLYRKAFIRRCYNLQTAEAEVDLLGDEVDALLRLLEKTFIALDHYSPVLKYYSGVKLQTKISMKMCSWASKSPMHAAASVEMSAVN